MHIRSRAEATTSHSSLLSPHCMHRTGLPALLCFRPWPISVSLLTGASQLTLRRPCIAPASAGQALCVLCGALPSMGCAPPTCSCSGDREARPTPAETFFLCTCPCTLRRRVADNPCGGTSQVCASVHARTRATPCGADRGQPQWRCTWLSFATMRS